MSWTPICKKPAPDEPAPNLIDETVMRAGFSWENARAELAGLPNGGLNIAYEAVDRQVEAGLGKTVALRWLGKNGERREYTYADLAHLSNRFANLLERLGIGKGDRVCTLAGRIPELYVTALGTLKVGAVFCPLFSAFGPEPVRVRVAKSRARLLVTTSLLYQRKILPQREQLPDLEHVLLADGDDDSNVRSFHTLMEAESDRRAPPTTLPEDWALLHFTSGTTGAPKGAVHVHDAVAAHRLTGRWVLDLRPGDVFWCTADPGWVTGVSYGIIAPLTNGVTLVVDEAEFDARRWYAILARERVNVWYTAPTAIRMLMKVGADAAHGHDLSALRFMASVGEPLNPEGVIWGLETLGQPFHDTWWQTETGAIMIANTRDRDIRPGSMGQPLPGVEAAIVRRRSDGGVDLLESGEEGELALRTGWPSMFRGYLEDEARYRQCFAADWYLSGDLATRDADGYFWFLGRSGDVIKTSGHLIGPFEVENVLLEHPAVAEAGMIGKPDDYAGQIVKVFVALKPDHAPDDALRRELLGFARNRLGPAVAPRELEFMSDLPKTRSGKIMRRLLRAQELGLPPGDLSTLENNDGNES
ncbi:acetate--CoA ligase [Candidatus Competibacter phosphatis]|uniref:acetate--CoA ligase n=1 Tax=Candidatus Competibacter phosphatis TaxID=221280 RepID=A0ABX1TK13_9GAMM|nr:acetate--CoA ligase [Candidatus Competibacter phosphatis]NMQ19081.1 acetate--CoA ligase [Candidatus Competibacter phosphatis]